MSENTERSRVPAGLRAREHWEGPEQGKKTGALWTRGATDHSSWEPKLGKSHKDPTQVSDC